MGIVFERERERWEGGKRVVRKLFAQKIILLLLLLCFLKDLTNKARLSHTSDTPTDTSTSTAAAEPKFYGTVCLSCNFLRKRVCVAFRLI